MKTILSILTVLALAGAAYAGCGKKVTDTGTLKSFDADTKEIVIEADGKESKFTATKNTAAKGKDGAEAKLDDLVGKNVTVTSEHGKADEVAES
ncbi:MAG: hypothetical protein AAF591_08930 [Verrucomicrobiota bacterium]